MRRGSRSTRSSTPIRSRSGGDLALAATIPG
jgi:hypothetical protein